jgi:hypothetical protein
MKKITLLLSILAISTTGFAQQKTTGTVTLSTNLTANLTLNNTTSKAILTLTGPSDRWFALQFGSFADGNGMASGQDVVYADGTTLVDGKMNGIGAPPPNDTTNNWTVTSNQIVSGVRTITAERNLSTGDINDYTFNYANSTIDFAWARRSSAGYALNYHGAANRGYQLSVPLTTSALGVADFSLKAATVYPNPSKGSFNVETKTSLDKINIYSQTGSLIKTIDVKDKSNAIEVDLKDSQKGIYLIELQNEKEKTWKKIIIE